MELTEQGLQSMTANADYWAVPIGPDFALLRIAQLFDEILLDKLLVVGHFHKQIEIATNAASLHGARQDADDFVIRSNQWCT